MPNLSRPPDVNDPRFMTYFYQLVAAVNALSSAEPSTPSTGIVPVSQGGSGATNLSGYLVGNGSSSFSAAQTIPWSDISDVPPSRQYGPNVDALNAAGTAGIYTITAVGSSASRTITGTSGTIAVTDGDGVAGNPTIDIDPAYVGQTSITTLGTVTSGTWNAGDVNTIGYGTFSARFIQTPLGNNYSSDYQILFRDTTNATTTELTKDGAAGSGTSNRIVVQTDTAMSVTLNICGKQQGSSNSVQFLRQFLIVDNGGTTALVGSVLTLGTDIASAALATASCTITANAADNCIKVEVSGVAATNIRWSAYLTATETTYA